MKASEHARVWFEAASALKSQLDIERDRDKSGEVGITTIAAYKLAFTVGAAYNAEAKRCP